LNCLANNDIGLCFFSVYQCLKPSWIEFTNCLVPRLRTLKPEDMSILAFDAVSLGQVVVLACLNLGTMILQNVRNYSPNDKVSHSRRLESSATPLREPQICSVKIIAFISISLADGILRDSSKWHLLYTRGLFWTEEFCHKYSSCMEYILQQLNVVDFRFIRSHYTVAAAHITRAPNRLLKSTGHLTNSICPQTQCIFHTNIFIGGILKNWTLNVKIREKE
jgi:hypothetical protein